MASVQVVQRNARLAGPVQCEYVNGRDGKIAKALLVAISNRRRGYGESRTEEATAVQWTLWGAHAESAAAYLGKGSHVNIVGRLRHNHYEKEGGEAAFGWSFTVEEIDFLDSRAESETLHARNEAKAVATSALYVQKTAPKRSAQSKSAAADDDMPF